MKWSILIVASVACAVSAAVFWRVWTDLSPTAAPATPAPALQKKTAHDPAAPEIERNAPAVFQRAFWRRPAAADRILHGERREWKDASGVLKWQWFVAVRPSREFRDWLMKENPFEIITCDPRESFATITEAPAWFLTADDVSAFAAHRNREGRYLVFFDPKTNRLFATDSGGGFAAAAR